MSLVLDAIAEGRNPVTLTELAQRTGLPRSTVHRLVQSLEAELYIARVHDRAGYVLGPGLLKFGMNAHRSLVAANHGRLVVIAREVNENVELAAFSGREVIVVDQVASPERLIGVSKLGKSFSLHASAIGLALLAELPDARVEQLLPADLRSFTRGTITNRVQLREELDRVRRSRVAVDFEMHDSGICAIAVATTGSAGTLFAVSVVIPTQRFRNKAAPAAEALLRIDSTVDVAQAMRARGLA